MTSRKLEVKHVQVLDTDWFKTDQRAVLAVLLLKSKMRCTKRNGANLRGWEPHDSWHRVAAETLTGWRNWNVMAPLLLETAKTHKTVNQEDVRDRTRAQIASVEKEVGRQLGRSELKSGGKDEH